jgi:hypothetical protein
MKLIKKIVMLSRSMKFSAKKEFFISSMCQSLIFKKVKYAINDWIII